MIKPAEEIKVFAALDFENLAKCMRDVHRDPEKFSLEEAFKGLLAWLKQIGRLHSPIRIFVPTTPECMNQENLELFQKYGFFTIFCPKIGAERIDTSDSNLAKYVKMAIMTFQRFDVLCIGSGDKDFSDARKYNLYRIARAQGIKMAVVGGSERSVAPEVRGLIDKHPITGEEMLHILSPVRK